MRFTVVFITFCLLTLFSGNAIAQKNNRLDRADKMFQAGAYYEAIDLYKDAYQRVTDKKEKARITFQVSECYRIINKPKQAAMWYSKVISKNYEDPIAVLYYADMLKMLENYEDAKVQYQAYKELVPGDSRAADGILSCDLALEWKEFPNGYVVEEMKFLNSRQNDYSPDYARNDYRMVYFTSAREETMGKKDHGGTGQGFSDIFSSTMDRVGKWSSPTPLGEEINTEHEEGSACLSKDYNTLYFTRCEKRDKKPLGCVILSASREGDSWGKPESLQLAEDSLVVAHPAISPDDLTLYFVSDMDGSMKDSKGENSKDIWKVTRTSATGDWGEPENLGAPINTSGAEMFPYVHADGALYFASNGHIGMGGLDIFKAVPVAGGNWDIENMRYL